MQLIGISYATHWETGAACKSGTAVKGLTWRSRVADKCMGDRSRRNSTRLRGAARYRAPVAPNGASTTAPQPPAAPAHTERDRHARITDAVRAWASAWAVGDIDRYLAAYDPSFTPGDGLSREAWLQVRRRRLAKAREITIAVDDLVIEPIGQATAEATFVQDYSARGMRERSHKTLMFNKAGDQWLIVSERSRPVSESAAGTSNQH